jgi:hypothetical protein
MCINVFFIIAIVFIVMFIIVISDLASYNLGYLVLTFLTNFHYQSHFALANMCNIFHVIRADKGMVRSDMSKPALIFFHCKSTHNKTQCQNFIC